MTHRRARPRIPRVLASLPLLLVLLPLAPGCGDDGGPACADGYHPEDGACVPTFDACPGPTEVPLPGGGCRSVGVTTCATGLAPDGEGGCDPTLPPDACPPGTLERLGEAGCPPVGVLACAEGFVADGVDGCAPVLPADPCPPGTLEQLGETGCPPLGDCEAGPWGDAVPEPSDVHVDAAYPGADADGSAERPFPTVAAAVAVADEGAQVLIAAGEYVERLALDRPLRLIGRCADRVVLRGGSVGAQDVPPVRVLTGADGALVRGVTLTGQDAGLSVAVARGVTLEASRVVDTGSFGVKVNGGAELRLLRVEVVRATLLGVYAVDGDVTVEASVVRETRPAADGRYGRGLESDCDPGTGACGSLTVTRSLVEANHQDGVYTGGPDAVVHASVVRGTLEQPSDGLFGRGIEAACDPDLLACPRLEVTGSVVTANRDTGVHVQGADLLVSSSVISDTRDTQVDGFLGRGLEARCDAATGRCGRLEVTDSVLARNRDSGIVTRGVDAVVSGSVVRDTQADVAEQGYGRGVQAECSPETGDCGRLDVTRTLIAGNREVGLYARGPAVTLVDSVVRDTLPQAADGTAGHGVGVEHDAAATAANRLDVRGSLIQGNHDQGVQSFGVDLSIAGSVVRDTLPRAVDGDGGRGISVQVDPFTGYPGSLTLEGSVISGTENVGVFLLGVDGEVTGTTIRDVRPNTAGPWEGNLGQGIEALCDVSSARCGSLVITGSRVEACHLVGVSIAGVAGRVEDTVIDTIWPRPSDDRYGYGVQVEGVPGAPPFTFDVIGCLVRDADLAGVLFAGATGTVRGSRILGADFSVVWSDPSHPPTVAADNDLAGDVEGAPTASAGLSPAPSPAPVSPTP